MKNFSELAIYSDYLRSKGSFLQSRQIDLLLGVECFISFRSQENLLFYHFSQLDLGCGQGFVDYDGPEKNYGFGGYEYWALNRFLGDSQTPQSGRPIHCGHGQDVYAWSINVGTGSGTRWEYDLGDGYGWGFGRGSYLYWPDGFLTSLGHGKNYYNL